MGRPEWEQRAGEHRDRLRPYVDPHLARREARTKHAVHDFLFTYYSQRPSQLLRWHPGFGVELDDAADYLELKGYGAAASSPTGAAVSTAYVRSQRVLIETLLRLLRATAERPANFGCFGMHEWAMVYRLGEDQTRHAQWPLRLGEAGTDTVVETHRIACSHFDAYRFFTPAAAPLNTLRPGSQDRPDFEQPACLHAGMDLYKHAFRLTPMVGSDLVADAFELAWDIRILDMRAAPYDLTGVVLDPSGAEWTPVRIETADGKAEYAAIQREFAARAAPIRSGLIRACERLLSAIE